MGGDQQIVGFDMEGSQSFHLAWDTILLLNAEVAMVEHWGNGTEVPIYDRLFLGGSNNLRGFNFRDVGPKDDNGEPLGGGTLVRATAEYTFPIIETGSRRRSSIDSGFVQPATRIRSAVPSTHGSDAGFGVRLDLPIGPIRIDYGIPDSAGWQPQRAEI